MNSGANSSVKLWIARRIALAFCAFCIVLVATNANALPEPKIAIIYSLETADGGAYFQKISETPNGIGDVEFVFDIVNSLDPSVTVITAAPLMVTIEYTADSPGGNIVDGPVELTNVDFEREFQIDASGLTLVTTEVDTTLARKGTGMLAGSTITWDNTVAPYQESVIGLSTCTGFGCLFVSDPFPRDLSGTFDVILPDFTVYTDSVFGDSFVSDNGTPGDPSDDIDRPDDDATVKDTWDGVEVPEPASVALLIPGVIALLGLKRLRMNSSAGA